MGTRVTLAVALTGVAAGASSLRAQTARVPAARGLPPGTSALDAWAACREAESRTYRLTEDGVVRFSCRIRIPYVEKLAGPGGPLEGAKLGFVLSWQADTGVRVTLAERDPRIGPDEKARLVGLVEPLAQVILSRPPTRALRGHAFRFVRGGSTVVEALARDPEDDRLRSTFTIGADGLIVRERNETRLGAVSEFAYRHERRGQRWLLSACEGTYHGLHVDIAMEWGAFAAGRPVPTRVIVHQAASDGTRLPGGLGEMVFVLSEHVLNAPAAEDVVGAPALPASPR